jgi:hypothetical protein
MADDAIRRAIEFHNLAVHAHRVAATHREKQDHMTAYEYSKRAMEHASKAFQFSKKALENSRKLAKQKPKRRQVTR